MTSLPNTISQNIENHIPQLRLDDTATPQIKIKINEVLFEKKLDTTCYIKPQWPPCYLISCDQIGQICLGGLAWLPYLFD